MSELPSADPQNPACGACRGETRFDGDDFVCDDCQLFFNPDNLSASFLDSEVEPCTARCDNWWHGDHKIQQGRGYDCGTCKLPTGHLGFHWTGCEPKSLVAALGSPVGETPTARKGES